MRAVKRPKQDSPVFCLENPSMQLPRPRFTIRRMMIVIAVLGVGAFVIAQFE